MMVILRPTIVLLLLAFFVIPALTAPITTTVEDDEDLSFSGIVSSIGRKLLRKGQNKLVEYMDEFLGRKTSTDEEDNGESTTTPRSKWRPEKTIEPLDTVTDSVTLRRRHSTTPRPSHHGDDSEDGNDRFSSLNRRSLSEKFGGAEQNDGGWNRRDAAFRSHD